MLECSSKRMRVECPIECPGPKAIKPTFNHDTLFVLFSYLKAKEFFVCQRVSTQWRAFNANGALWKILFIRECLFTPAPQYSLEKRKSDVKSLVKLQDRYATKVPTYHSKIQYFTDGDLPFLEFHNNGLPLTIHIGGAVRRWNLRVSTRFCVKLFDISRVTSLGAGSIVKIQLFFQHLILVTWENQVTQLWSGKEKVLKLIFTLPKNVPITAWDCTTQKAVFAAKEGSVWNVYTWNFNEKKLTDTPLFSEKTPIDCMKVEGTQVFYTIDQTVKKWDSTTNICSTMLIIPTLTSAKNIAFENGILSFIAGSFDNLEIWNCHTGSLMLSQLSVQAYTRFLHFVVLKKRATIEIHSMTYLNLYRTLPFIDTHQLASKGGESILKYDSKGNIFYAENLIGLTGMATTALHSWNFND